MSKQNKDLIANDIFNKLSKNSYLEIYIVSYNKIVDKIKVKDIGQKFVKSQKLNQAFILPDRSEGLQYGFKTIFFYDSGTSTPLTHLEEEDKEEIDKQDAVYIFGVKSNNKIQRFKAILTKNPVHMVRYDEKTRKIQPFSWRPTTIDSSLLNSLLDTQIITDVIKTPVNIFEALKIPIIVGSVCAVIIVMLLTT